MSFHTGRSKKGDWYLIRNPVASSADPANGPSGHCLPLLQNFTGSNPFQIFPQFQNILVLSRMMGLVFLPLEPSFLLTHELCARRRTASGDHPRVNRNPSRIVVTELSNPVLDGTALFSHTVTVPNSLRRMFRDDDTPWPDTWNLPCSDLHRAVNTPTDRPNRVTEPCQRWPHTPLWKRQRNRWWTDGRSSNSSAAAAAAVAKHTFKRFRTTFHQNSNTPHTKMRGGVRGLRNAIRFKVVESC